MTTDPTPLQERIARAMWAGFAADQGYTTTWEELPEYVQGTYLHAAAAVLPLIAAEVRKAQADALRDAADFWQDTATHNTPADIEPDWLRARAMTTGTAKG